MGRRKKKGGGQETQRALRDLRHQLRTYSGGRGSEKNNSNQRAADEVVLLVHKHMRTRMSELTENWY